MRLTIQTTLSRIILTSHESRITSHLPEESRITRSGRTTSSKSLFQFPRQRIPGHIDLRLFDAQRFKTGNASLGFVVTQYNCIPRTALVGSLQLRLEAPATAQRFQ